MPSLGSVVQSTVDPWAIQQRIGTTDARYALNSVLMPVPNLSYVDYRSGVMASGDTAGVGGSSHMAMRVLPGSGMQVTVEMGNAVINTQNQGAYMCCLDSKAELTIDAASASANRIDLVVARVYDDRNSAIGSPVDTRQFTVEVWKGDESSGTPQPPAITSLATAGVIPLAEVRVNANTSNITQSMLTDRRGPGIVARGGVRGLYGADAVAAINAGHTAEGYEGAYPGDQRWVHTNGFQHQIYYGKGDNPKRSGWRGVHNALVYNANPAPGSGVVWYKANGSVNSICSVTIPYPGTPFMIYPTGRLEMWLGREVQADLRITINSPTGPAVNWTTSHSFGMPNDRRIVTNVPPIMFGPFTDDLTVYLSGYLRASGTNYGWGYDRSNRQAHLLSVVVYPSTVQPPNDHQGNDGSGDDLLDQDATGGDG